MLIIMLPVLKGPLAFTINLGKVEVLGNEVEYFSFAALWLIYKSPFMFYASNI